MISVRAISKAYRTLPVLRSLSCEFRRGVITGLAGPNACGKTTLIKAMLGLVRPDAGEIFIGGAPVSAVSCRERIGYMPQQAEFPRNLTARELCAMISALRGRPLTRFDELVERFHLAPFLEKPLGQLSTGTRQKISAVVALGVQPEVLILDEPTAGFDPLACVTFKALLLDAVAQGATVVLVSHIIPELEQLIGDLVFLLDGRVLFAGEVSALAAETGVPGLEAGLVKLLSARPEGEGGAP